MRVLGINAVFHDPAAALVVDGRIVAAAEEERFSRRKHGKRPVAVLGLGAARAGGRLVPGAQAGLRPADLDAVAYSYDPALAQPRRRARPRTTRGTTCGTMYAQRAPRLPRRRRCPASTRRASASCRTTSRTPPRPASPRRIATSRRAGRSTAAASGRPTWPAATRDGALRDARRPARCRTRSGCSTRSSPQHLGFLRSSDEYKVMAMASYGTPRFLRRAAASSSTPPATAASVTEPVDWAALAPRAASRATSLDAGARRPRRQRAARLEEVLLDLARLAARADRRPAR